MVVICARTAGDNTVGDLHFNWTLQKRLQSSYGTNDAQAASYNDLIMTGWIDPALGRTVSFTDIPVAVAEMGRGEEVFGNIAALVGATVPGTGADTPEILVSDTGGEPVRQLPRAAPVTSATLAAIKRPGSG